jgi:hypothetical protein
LSSKDKPWLKTGPWAKPDETVTENKIRNKSLFIDMEIESEITAEPLKEKTKTTGILTYIPHSVGFCY